MPDRIRILYPGGKTASQELPDDERQRLRLLQDLVGGHLEVALQGAQYLVAWEGAKGTTHVVNKAATAMAREAESIPLSDYLAGTVLVVPQGALR